jgi:hypothetical protein
VLVMTSLLYTSVLVKLACHYGLSIRQAGTITGRQAGEAGDT